VTEFDFDINEELEEIKVSSLLRSVTEKGRALLLKRLLGPLLTPGILTPKEAAFFFLNAALDKSPKMIAKSFKCDLSGVYSILSKAENKIREHRKNNERI
jgi:hypothetical protein